MGQVSITRIRVVWKLENERTFASKFLLDVCAMFRNDSKRARFRFV